jgi:hypothetical protein
LYLTYLKRNFGGNEYVAYGYSWKIDVTKRDPAKGCGTAPELRLADFIRQEKEAVIEEWVTFAKTRVPPGENMTQLALRDHIVELLDFIADDLKSSQSDEEQANKSKGDGPLRGALPLSAAELHAMLRLNHGFNINQMVSEYRARASVLRQWRGWNRPKGRYLHKRFDQVQ